MNGSNAGENSDQIVELNVDSRLNEVKLSQAG